MDNSEANLQRLFGEVSCTTLVMQLLIQTHPNKAAFTAALKKLADDVPDIVAMNHPGRPAIDQAFRNLLAIFEQAAEQQPESVRFPRFGTGAGI